MKRGMIIQEGADNTMAVWEVFRRTLGQGASNDHVDIIEHAYSEWVYVYADNSTLKIMLIADGMPYNEMIMRGLSRKITKIVYCVGLLEEYTTGKGAIK